MKLVSSLLLGLLGGCLAMTCRGAEGHFHSGDTPIRYLVDGSGEPVVLIHGITRTADLDWVETGVFQALRAHFQVLALDNRGHGKSGKPHSGDAYGATMLEDVLGLLDHLKIEKAHLVGYSMGGRMALKMMTLWPERIKSVVLIGSGGVLEEKDLVVFNRLVDSLEAGTGATPLLRAIWPEGSNSLSDEQVEALNQQILAANDLRAIAAVARGFREWKVTETSLRANRVPVLALVGSRDPALSAVRRLKSRLDPLQIQVFEGADHVGILRRPELVEILTEFINSEAAAAEIHQRTGRPEAESWEACLGRISSN